MNKLKIVGLLSAVTLLALPVAASAATISDPLFSNGDTTIDAQGNSTVNGTYTIQVGANEVCEVVRTQAAPQAFTDTQVGGTLGLQQGTYTNQSFSVRVSPNTGTYYPTIQCAGIWGGQHSVDGADNVVATGNLGTIRVTANGSGGGGLGSLDALSSLIASLTAQVGCMTSGGTWANNACAPKPPVPAASAACTAYAQANAGTQQGVRNSANIRLQGFLLSQGMDIPALAAGASFGFYGPQTGAANVAFLAMNHCN